MPSATREHSLRAIGFRQRRGIRCRLSFVFYLKLRSQTEIDLCLEIACLACGSPVSLKTKVLQAPLAREIVSFRAPTNPTCRKQGFGNVRKAINGDRRDPKSAIERGWSNLTVVTDKIMAFPIHIFCQ